MLPHALFILFGKASHKFFEVVDSVKCLDSESVELDSVIVYKSKLPKLDSKFSLDSLSLRF